MLIHMLFHFYVSIWFPCLMLTLVWRPMHDLWFLRCWKMYFEPKTEIECLIELVSRDRTWFISNLKTLELNAWFDLLRIQGIGTWWVIIDSKFLWIGFEYFCEFSLFQKIYNVYSLNTFKIRKTHTQDTWITQESHQHDKKPLVDLENHQAHTQSLRKTKPQW